MPHFTRLLIGCAAAVVCFGPVALAQQAGPVVGNPHRIAEVEGDIRSNAAVPLNPNGRTSISATHPLSTPTLLAQVTASLIAKVSGFQAQGATPSGNSGPSSALAVGMEAADYTSQYWLTHVADGGGWSTTLNLINPSKAAANYQIQLRDDAANPLVITSGSRTGSTFEGSLPPGTSVTLTSSGPSTLSQGIAQVGTTAPLVASGIFTSRVPGRPDLEAAVPSFSAPAQSLLLPFDNQGGKSTGVALANTGDSPVTVTFAFGSEAGGVLNGGTLSLGPRTKTEFNLTDKFPQAQGVRGTLVMSAAAPVLAALGLRFLPSGTFTSLPVYSTDASTTSLARQVLSHVVDGGGWLSIITIVNLDPQPATYQLRTFDTSGNPLALILNGTMSTTFSGTIPGLSSVTLSTPGTSSDLLQGWADLTSSGRIRAQLMFDQMIPGQSVFEAAVPAIGDGQTALAMPYDNTGGLVTGVAVANSGGSESSVQMLVRDELGAITDIKTLKLAAGAKTAFVLTEQAPNSAGKRGLIVLVAPTSSISVLALRFNGPAFTTLPIAPIDPATGVPISGSGPPPAPKLPAAPTIQATASSSSQVRVTWTSSESGILRFRLERRAGSSGTFAEVAQPGATARSYDDGGLAPSALYAYRIRVETAAGLSAYSTEVSSTTLQGLPNAPTNLQVTATTSTDVSLSWTNNAPDAIAIQVEYRQVGTASFIDSGAAASLTRRVVPGLQSNSAYSFRARAQNSQGYSTYSNEVSAATLPPPATPPTTVFLIHGINQGSYAMWGLYNSLTGPSGVSPHSRVNGAFDFSECADTNFCSSNCSIPLGAKKLARHIIDANPPGDIVLIGFSMGGLIARDMMVNNWYGVLTGRRVAALITLGTPNLGYPYTGIDTLVTCTPLVQAMDGNWRSQQGKNVVVLSPYLLPLANQWSSAGYPGSGGTWMAASGRSCSNQLRILDSTTGCRDLNRYSDGVVCDDSASYNFNTSSGTGPNPALRWQDPGYIYAHTSSRASLILCPGSGDPILNPLLSDPPAWDSLFKAIKGVINGQ